ncbi:aspartate 1-decarboxylase [Candidatus Aerophobetes bacterium]|nr:aspartate 1-decarboxylase [Candidatus Aerophobetes bacterium]
MFKIMCRSKIHRARVTKTQLNYEGSITIDEDLMQAAEILPGEKLEIYNLNNGARFSTYAISGEKGSGIICINGAAARLAQVGDEIIIVSYVLATEEEAKKMKMRIIRVDKNNKICSQ